MSSPEAAAAPIECSGLTKYYGPVLGVEDITLRLEPGSITGFLGPNGAGKTTLLRLLGGLLHATRGEALLFGVAASEPRARRGLGYMPAEPVFVRSLSGHENLDLLSALQGSPPIDRARVADRLEMPNSVLARTVGGYSSGMVQKLALVQAFQHRPDLVVLDEPANRLDPIMHHAFEGLIRDVARERRTVLLSSHTLSEVELLCERVAMIDHGHLLVHTTTSELTTRAPRQVTIRYRSLPDQLPEGLRDAHLDGTRVYGRVGAGEIGVLRELLDDPRVDDLLIEPSTLEDVFLDLFRQGPDHT